MGVIIPAPLLWGLNEIRYVRILCKAKHIIKTWILTCLEIKMEDNTTMIKWLIFHLESGVCFLAIQGLAELGTFSISQCFFCLGRSNPSPTSASREVHRESLAVSPQPCPHPVCLLDANRKKLTEGSRAKLSRHVSPCPPGSWILSTLVAWVTSLPLLPRSPGEEFSIRLLLLLPHLHWKAKMPCPWLKGKSQINLSDTTANVNSLPCLS